MWIRHYCKRRSHSLQEIAIETLVEIALREYIQRRKQPQHLELSFGESLSAFREKYQLHELGLNPDEI